MQKHLKLILLLLAVIPLSLFCQKKDSTQTGKIALGFTFSPDYCYREVLTNKESAAWMKDLRDDYDIPKIGFTTGFSLRLKLNKRLSLETGLLLSNKGEKTRKYDLFVPTSQQMDPFVPRSVVYRYDYLFIDIPATANFFITTNKLKIYVAGGIAANVFLVNRIHSTQTFQDGHTKEGVSSTSSGFSRFGLSGNFGFGLIRDVNKNMFFKIEPMVRSFIIANPKNSNLSHYYYSAGVNFGVYYKL